MRYQHSHIFVPEKLTLDDLVSQKPLLAAVFKNVYILILVTKNEIEIELRVKYKKEIKFWKKNCFAHHLC